MFDIYKYNILRNPKVYHRSIMANLLSLGMSYILTLMISLGLEKLTETVIRNTTRYSNGNSHAYILYA